MKTIFEQFEESVKNFPHNEAVAVLDTTGGTYNAVTYKKLFDNVFFLAERLAQDVSRGDRVAIFLPNGPEWFEIDLACARIGAIVVPIHATYNAHYINLILNHAEPTLVFISRELLDTHANEISYFKKIKIIIVGQTTSSQHNQIAYHEYSGKKNTSKGNSFPNVSPDDIHTIVYTSGTTGSPKGVMLTHANLISNALASHAAIPILPTDRFFSFLPLSHIFERTCGYYVPLFTGASVYFAQSAKTMIEEIKLACPTILVCVPRVFERVHEKIIARFAKRGFLQRLFKHAMHTAQHRSNAGGFKDQLLFLVYDTIIFKRVRSVFGGRLRFAVSGGASLSKHIAEFFDKLGILVLEGYGLTETSPVITCNRPDAYRFGSVGKVVDGAEIRLAEGNEIVVRGTGVMQGYYKSESQTAEAIDTNRWFHTGDLGRIDADGFLTIVGRQKEMIVLSNGKNVSPVPIEQALEESKYIKQAMVYADKAHHLVALIVPDFEVLKNWCVASSMQWLVEEVLKRDDVNELYLHEIQKQLVRFQSFEQIYNFKLLASEFTIENGMVTPTLKLKRVDLLHKYE